MDRIKGLKEYIRMPVFKEALCIPEKSAVECVPLAQGEYNINYLFRHPVSGQKLVLRINTGSQMHLKNQIEYEYKALRLLEHSGRTPKPLYVDGSKKYLDYGIMVMEFLKGKPLDYRKDMLQAAGCLADIHSVQATEESGLLNPVNPLQAVIDECREMVRTYNESKLGDLRRKKQIERMLKAGQKKIEQFGSYKGYRCCINTELNSGNFLINGKNGPNYLIDWEKPLYGDPVQDLGHFLAPTTTFWKTDVILTEKEMDEFADGYMYAVKGRFDTKGIKERLKLYIPVTCLRGITWCAMAWVQYQEADKMIRNEETFKKIESYLTEEFLETIEKRYYI